MPYLGITLDSPPDIHGIPISRITITNTGDILQGLSDLPGTIQHLSVAHQLGIGVSCAIIIRL